MLRKRVKCLLGCKGRWSSCFISNYCITCDHKGYFCVKGKLFEWTYVYNYSDNGKK